MLMLNWQGSGLQPYKMGLQRFEDRALHARPAFDRIADQIRLTNDLQFQSKGRHIGPRWAPLSPRYAAWKRRNYGRLPIMVLSGDLRKALTERPFGIEIVHNRGLTVGTDIPYAKYHQHGVPGLLPRRQLLGQPNIMETKLYAKILQEWIVEGRVMT